jgi:hypothetical protein
MLLELLLTATCVIGAGVEYTPPQGWTLERVTFQGQIDACSFDKGSSYGTCVAINYPRHANNAVTLRRTVQVGEQVQAPEGCALTSEARDAPGNALCRAEPTLAGCPQNTIRQKEPTP